MAYKRLSLIRGNSQTYNLLIKNRAGVPYCLKNWVLFFTLKTNIDLPDSEASLQKIVTTFADTTAGTSGSASVSLLPEDTASLAAGEYHYDFKVRTAAGEVVTVLTGMFDLEHNVTISAGTSGTA